MRKRSSGGDHEKTNPPNRTRKNASDRARKERNHDPTGTPIERQGTTMSKPGTTRTKARATLNKSEVGNAQPKPGKKPITSQCNTQCIYIGGIRELTMRAKTKKPRSEPRNSKKGAGEELTARRTDGKRAVARLIDVERNQERLGIRSEEQTPSKNSRPQGAPPREKKTPKPTENAPSPAKKKPQGRTVRSGGVAKSNPKKESARPMH